MPSAINCSCHLQSISFVSTCRARLHLPRHPIPFIVRSIVWNLCVNTRCTIRFTFVSGSFLKSDSASVTSACIKSSYYRTLSQCCLVSRVMASISCFCASIPPLLNLDLLARSLVRLSQSSIAKSKRYVANMRGMKSPISSRSLLSWSSSTVSGLTSSMLMPCYVAASRSATILFNIIVFIFLFK